MRSIVFYLAIYALFAFKAISQPKECINEIISNSKVLDSVYCIEIEIHNIKEMRNLKYYKNAKILIIRNYKWKKLPKSIYSFNKLTYLLIDGSNIRKIPPKIEKIKSIETFILHDSRIKYVSPSIQNLENLKQLTIKGNEFKKIPSVFFNMKNIQYINLKKYEYNRKFLYNEKEIKTIKMNYKNIKF